MKKLVLIGIVFVAGIALLAFNRPVKNKTFPAFLSPDSLFHSGDIIFRDGRGVISTIFRSMSKTSQAFSHAGILHWENNRLFVLHVIGGEGRSSVMRKELLSEFCKPGETNEIAVYRSGLDAKKIDSLTCYYYSKGIAFDDKFDLETDDKMYCTELVYKVLTRVSQIDNFLPLTTVNNVTYCACDNIFLSPHLEKIYSYKYK